MEEVTSMKAKDIYTENAEKALADGHKTYETLIVRLRWWLTVKGGKAHETV